MICPICGNGVKKAAKFCTVCGGKMTVPASRPAKPLHDQQPDIRTPSQSFPAPREPATTNRHNALSANHRRVSASEESTKNLIWYACFLLVSFGVPIFIFRSDARTVLWLLAYAADLCFWYWMAFLGGAKWMTVDYKSFLIFDFWALLFNEEMLKLFAWIIFAIHTIVFVSGIFYPGLRSFGFNWL